MVNGDFACVIKSLAPSSQVVKAVKVVFMTYKTGAKVVSAPTSVYRQDGDEVRMKGMI